MWEHKSFWEWTQGCLLPDFSVSVPLFSPRPQLDTGLVAYRFLLYLVVYTGYRHEPRICHVRKTCACPGMHVSVTCFSVRLTTPTHPPHACTSSSWKAEKQRLENIFYSIVSKLRKSYGNKVKIFYFEKLGILKFLSLILNGKLTLKCQIINKLLMCPDGCNHIWLSSSRMWQGRTEGPIFFIWWYDLEWQRTESFLCSS